MSRLPEYFIYSDGACKGNPGPGGYGTLVLTMKELDFTEVGRFARGYFDTTNNRMEIRGVIQVLKYFEEPVDIEIVSDSQYVISSITGGYAKKWLEEKDFSKKNLDLWFELIDLVEFHNVTFTWVKGHNGDKWNELADTLAVVSARCLNISEEWTQQSS